MNKEDLGLASVVLMLAERMLADYVYGQTLLEDGELWPLVVRMMDAIKEVSEVVKKRQAKP